MSFEKNVLMGWRFIRSWWRHQMETFSALLALCAGNSPVPGEFPAQRPVTRSFDVIFDLHPNKRLSIQSWSWWFETLSCSLWRHCNVNYTAASVVVSSYFELFNVIHESIWHWQARVLPKTLQHDSFTKGWRLLCPVEYSRGCIWLCFI